MVSFVIKVADWGPSCLIESVLNLENVILLHSLYTLSDHTGFKCPA